MVDRKPAGIHILTSHAKWLFPAFLVLATCAFGALKISGSSVGVYSQYFYGNAHDSHLIFGYPQPVRGDEWNTVTPIVLSQAAHNYPLNSSAIGENENMSVLLDVPYRSWLVSLRPWNLWFLFLPVATAFALKWWTMLALLAAAAYFFILKLRPRRYWFAALGASFLALSPFIQWWYRDYLIATIAFGLIAVLIAMKLTESRLKPWQKGMLSLLLGYVIAAFVFIEYPPFQIMTAFSLGVFYIGWLFRQGLFAKDTRKALIRALAWIFGGVIVAAVILAVYYAQDHQAISAVLHTTFPAKRSYASGLSGLSMFVHLLSSPFSAELQRHTAAAVQYWANQSEAALFIQYSPILCLPLGYGVIQTYRRSKQLRWDLILLIVGTALLYADMFIPHLGVFFRIFLFYEVPPNRMALGLGLLDFLSIITLAIYFAKRPIRRRYALCIAALSCVVFFCAGWYTEHTYPGYIQSLLLVIGASVWMALGLWFLLRSRATLAMAMLVLLSIASVYRVNPLYQGLAPLTQTPLATTIQAIVKHAPNKQWLTTDFKLQQYPQANGARSLTGDYSYPQSAIWKMVDSKPADTYIYNRATHVLADISSSNGLQLAATNLFVFDINPCSPLVARLNIGYLLTTSPESSQCLNQISKITFPALTTYIYEFRQPG